MGIAGQPSPGGLFGRRFPWWLSLPLLEPVLRAVIAVGFFLASGYRFFKPEVLQLVAGSRALRILNEC